MSLRPLQKITLLLFSSTAFLSAFLCFGQEKPAPAPAPEPAKKETPAAVSNQRNGLKQVEDDLFRPLKGFSPNSSLDAPFTVPPNALPSRVPAESAKAREKREREKDWVFMNPDEFMTGPTLEEILNIPSKDKNRNGTKKLTPFEDYYSRTFHLADKEDNTTHKSPGKSQRVTQPGRLDQTDDDYESSLSPGLRDTQRALKSLSGNDHPQEKVQSGGDNFFTDIFGLGKNLPTTAEIEAKRVQKARMDEFKQILGIPVTASTADSLNPLGALGQPSLPSAPAVTGLPSGSSLARPIGSGAQLGTISGFSSGIPSAFGNDRSSVSSLSAPAPVIEQPKPHRPEPATFVPPRRPF